MPDAAPLGRLYGVGIGPGDPELMTRKAHRLIRQSPVILIPKRSLNEEGYAHSIVRACLRPDAQEIVPLAFPMHRDWQGLQAVWDQNVASIWERLRQGLDAVFVTEGDPFLYSTFIYIYEGMRRQHPEVQIEVVPGVSSFLAAAAATGIPLVNQEQRIAILPGLRDLDDTRRVLEQFDTVVFLKVRPVFEQVCALLEELGRIGQAYCVTKVSRPGEQEIVTDIRTLRGRGLEYLSLLVVSRQRTGAESVTGEVSR